MGGKDSAKVCRVQRLVNMQLKCAWSISKFLWVSFCFPKTFLLCTLCVQVTNKFVYNHEEDKHSL